MKVRSTKFLAKKKNHKKQKEATLRINPVGIEDQEDNYYIKSESERYVREARTRTRFVRHFKIFLIIIQKYN